MTRRTVLTAAACYLAVVLLVVGFAVLRVRTQNRFAAQVAPESLPYEGRTLTPPDEHANIPTVPASLDAVLDSLEGDHAFLLEGDVFTPDFIDELLGRAGERLGAEAGGLRCQ